MRIDLNLYPAGDFAAIGAEAAGLEARGADGVLVQEVDHDPFVTAVSALAHTARARVATRVAVAFARSPATVALAAHDLQLFSGGRFVLGLGSQVRAHIERRYSMPWSDPAARMREFVEALGAFWRCWNQGEPLHFEGRYYRHTLMSPTFSPPPSPLGPPPVHLAAVGERMAETVGQVADGLFVHALCTPEHLTQGLLPAVARGRAQAGRPPDGVEVSVCPFVATGRDEAELAVARAAVRSRIAFYASTPAYRGVLERHGWDALHQRLRALARAGEWAAMGDLVDDEVLDAFAVVGEPAGILARVRARFGPVAGRASLNTPYALAPAALAEVMGPTG